MTSSAPSVILSGFSDEAAIDKTAVQQFSAFAALGLKWFSLRFIDAGNGIKNVMQLSDDEIKTVKELMDSYGLRVATIGSPLGKVKLKDVDDGTNNRYVPFDEYLKGEVVRACELAQAFDCKLIRGFSYYHPKGTNPEDHLEQACDQLGQIAETCDKHGLTYGLEIEANLIGQTGQLMAELHSRINHPALVTIFDGANILCQGFSADQVFEQYAAMKPGLGWLHIKDYHDPNPSGRVTHVDEEALKNFVPADRGDCGHEAILRDLAGFIPELETRMAKRGAPGVICDLEPHVKGGGQFGGFSGPDGFGVAMRGLCRVLDYVGVGYETRGFADIKATI